MTIDTLDPERLAEFLKELEAAGFTPLDNERTLWEGPLPPSLQVHTDATMMRICIRDGWPYVQPTVEVAGLRSWHVSGDGPCLWQEGDNSKRWITLDGILERSDEWAAKAADGFSGFEGAALDPQYHFEGDAAGLVAVDVADVIAGLEQDGQHGLLDFTTSPGSNIPTVARKRKPGGPSGRWFYRAAIHEPPRDLAAFEAALTDKQRARYEKDSLTWTRRLCMLVWPSAHGLACLILDVNEQDGERRAAVFDTTPASQQDRLRRAGPDAPLLSGRRVALFGAGAIGSHVASLLARSGLGKLRAVDADRVTPVVQVRHAGGAAGAPKVDALVEELRRFEWVEIEPVRRTVWNPTDLAALIADADLCIDATGNSLFAELLSRVAIKSGVPMVTAALYRGGRIARVRRQAAGDVPIVGRADHWRYPTIPKAPDESTDYVGVETGCAAPIHNAPPAAVTTAAALCARVAIDALTGRFDEDDEVIEALDPIEAPFDARGRFVSAAPTVLVSDAARSAMVGAAAAAHPRETGGILIGVYDGRGEPSVVEAVELASKQPSVARYVVPADATTAAVEDARQRDGRLGYLGEWHSHPSDQPASPTDVRTMRRLAATSGTRTPVLIVAQPQTPDSFELDAYVVVSDRLVQTRQLDVGPLEPEEVAR